MTAAATVEQKRCPHCKHDFPRPASKHMTNTRWRQKTYCTNRCAFLATKARRTATEAAGRVYDEMGES